MIIADILLRKLNDEERHLVTALFQGHIQAALENDNLSSQVFKASFMATEDAGAAMIAALCTTGTHHAPIIKARQMIYGTDDTFVKKMLANGHRFPGFGNSFFKDGIDPAFQEVAEILSQLSVWERVLKIQSLIAESKGKVIHPNAAAFTAAVAEHLQLDLHETLWLFLAPRSAAWIQLIS